MTSPTRLSFRNVGDVIVIDEDLFDDTLSQGRHRIAKAGDSFEVLHAFGNQIVLAPRTDDVWSTLVAFWPDDFSKVRHLGKNDPLDEEEAWGYYDG